MKRIDWYKHYKNKLPSINFSRKELKLFYNQNKEFIDEIIKSKPNRVIEVGCGLARDSFVLASKRISVAVFDIDKRILGLASKNMEKTGVRIRIIKGNFFRLSNYIKKDYFDLAFHSGVLEHYNNNEIIKIIDEQIKIVPKIIFSVPIKSKFNERYFNDNLFRRLLTKEEWQKILSSFNIVRMERIESRHNDLLIVIEK